MKVSRKDSPRVFTVGLTGDVHLSDTGEIHLAPDEQVTFVTASGRRYDVTRKAWGFYATPSLNSRLKNEGFRSALVQNTQGRLFVMLVESGQLKRFDEYCRREKQTVLRWFDETAEAAAGASHP